MYGTPSRIAQRESSAATAGRLERCDTRWRAAGGTSQRGVPGFVVAIFVTLFLLFNTFAVSMWLQFRRRGRWVDPAFAERVYLILSLVAKSALAWQVSGALAGG